MSEHIDAGNTDGCSLELLEKEVSDRRQLTEFLQPGRSLMDWVKFSSEHRATAFPSGAVSVEELQKHSKSNDCWILLFDKVYDVTHYLSFHPGGQEQLMRVAGRDATSLFNEYHMWVNSGALLKACFVGNFCGDRKKLPKPDRLKTLQVVNMKRLDIKRLEDSSGKLILKSSTFLELKKENVSVTATDLSVRLLIRPYGLKSYSLQWASKLPSYRFDDVSLNVKNGTIEVEFIPKIDFSTVHYDSLFFHYSTEFHPGTIQKAVKIGKDTFLYAIQLPKKTILSIPIGHHVNLKIPSKEKKNCEIYRPYTPVQILDEGQMLYFIIKIYENGLFTPQLSRLSIGDVLEVSDPKSDFNFYKYSSSHLLLIAAGTGITPMFRIIAYRLKHPQWKTKIMCFNKSEEYIMPTTYMKSLIGCDVDHPNLTISHWIESCSNGWDGCKGYINKESILLNLKSFFNDKYHVIVCGSYAFSECTLRLLKDIDIPEEKIYCFKE